MYSAFIPGEHTIENLEIQKVKYGEPKTLYLPELFDEEQMIEVFSDSARPCETKEVKTKLKLLNEKFKLLIFSVDKKTLTLRRLQLWTLQGFDTKGNALIKCKETVYSV